MSLNSGRWLASYCRHCSPSLDTDSRPVLNACTGSDVHKLGVTYTPPDNSDKQMPGMFFYGVLRSP